MLATFSRAETKDALNVPRTLSTEGGMIRESRQMTWMIMECIKHAVTN